MQFRDDSIYGNDKVQAIKLYPEYRGTMDEADKSILLFAGDGINDLGAAGHTNLLFLPNMVKLPNSPIRGGTDVLFPRLIHGIL